MAKRKDRSWFERRFMRHTFQVEMAENGWSGYQVESLLRRQGILVFDRFVSTKEEEFLKPFIRFAVYRWRANHAEYTMIRAGVPVLGPLFNERNANVAPRPGQVGSISPGGWGTRNLDWMTRFIDFLTPIVGFKVGDYGHDLPVVSRKRR